MQKITTFLTFNNQAEDAMNFYTSVFSAVGGSASDGKDTKVVSVMRLPASGPAEKGAFMAANIQLHGQEFTLLNGGPHFTFSQGISLFVKCETQKEIDELWEKLSEGGEKQQCGWLKDRFGVSWQIVPPVLGRLLGDKDPEKSKRVLDAMLKMTKIEIKALEDAYSRQEEK
jgi:predicted 3-demethylubiquinone-9 3-methyltransferase (glyoxalase superfamily)